MPCKVLEIISLYCVISLANFRFLLIIKEGVNKRVVFWLGVIVVMRISRLRFKHIPSSPSFLFNKNTDSAINRRVSFTLYLLFSILFVF